MKVIEKLMGTNDFEGFSTQARDHAQNPRHYGKLDPFDAHARITGPCGDTMEFWLAVREEKVDRIAFITDGCLSSRACGSMAACLAEGLPVEEAADLSQEDILEALGGMPEESEHCALLAANTLKAACEDYRQHQKNNPEKIPSPGSLHATGAPREKQENLELENRRQLQARLAPIRHKILVLSGKGGVGKSTVAVNLAAALRFSGKRVGLLDVDIHGPSIPTLLGLEREMIQAGEEGLRPIEKDGLKVMSLGFLLRNPDDAVIWRGPIKMGVINQFLKDVEWGGLDYLIIDCPPGTGDEPLSVCQLIGTLDGAVVVTTPQKVAAVDVRKSITFCRQLKVPVLGVVENMSGFVCPQCGTLTPILRAGGGQRIAEDMQVPFLGSIPMDPQIAEACDNGQAFIQHFSDSPTAKILREVIQPVLALDARDDISHTHKLTSTKEDNIMRIAIPLVDEKLALHFGHCDRFALVDVDPKEKKIVNREDVEAPPHQPGLLPQWLADQQVNLIIAGGMGQRALGLFQQKGIQVVIGSHADTPEQLVADYLAGTLREGENLCDH